MTSCKKNLLFAALVLVGCGRMDSEAEFSAALPTRDMLEVKTPGQTGQALTSPDAVHAFGEGDTSELYKTTRNTTALVNGSTLAVLGLVEAVVKHRPTSVTGDTAVWGPHSEALQRNTWKLTVTRTGETTYRYALAGKAKADPDSAFVDVITGTQTVALDAAGEPMRGFGQGELTVDWERARRLPEHDGNTGRFNVRYSRPDAQRAIQVDATFQEVTDSQSAALVGANYRYSSIPGQGGEFDFKLLQDIYKPSGASSQQETLTIKSRWQASGAGRSDVELSGGDLPPTPATLNECWDTRFTSQYLLSSYGPEHYGTESTDCVFTSAVYSSL